MIYAIYKGCYSDAHAIGYFDEVEDAEQYVTQKSNGDEWEDPYVVRIGKMDAIDSRVEIHRHHRVVFYIGEDMLDDPNDYEVYTGSKKVKSFWANKKVFHFFVTTETRKKAEKIAQDYYAEYMSLVEEYGHKGAKEQFKSKVYCSR